MNLIILGILIIASVFTRFYGLDHKPIHFDESINGWFVHEMWKNGFFKYDPTNYHGPLHFYLLQIAEVFAGQSIVAYRFVTSGFGFLSILALIWFYKKEFFPMLIAVLLFMLSPGQIFFARSAIHESGLVFFLMISFWGIYRFLYFKEEKVFPLFIIGLFGAAFYKETFAIYFLSLLFAVLVVNPRQFWSRFKQVLFQIKIEWKIFLAGWVTLFLLFSGFARFPFASFDFFKAFLPWTKTGVQGVGHEKSFWYWSELILKNEWFVILAIGILLLSQFWKKQHLLFLIVFSLFNWFIYSWIPYKTPWCIIAITWTFVFLAAEAAREIQTRHVKIFVSICVGVVSAHGLWKSIDLSFQKKINLEHPYVYVQSTYQLKTFLDSMSDLFKNNPSLKEEKIQVATQETFPFPWYFGHFTSITYGNVKNFYQPNALIYMIDESEKTQLESMLRGSYDAIHFNVRASRAPIWLYVQSDWFKPYIEELRK